MLKMIEDSNINMSYHYTGQAITVDPVTQIGHFLVFHFHREDSDESVTNRAGYSPVPK